MKKYFLLILVFLGAWVFWNKVNVKHSVSNITPEAAMVETIKWDFPYVQINNIKIPVEIAKTEAEVQKGLSGRKSLATDKGMLFVFNKPDYYRFWMPNMNFPIDIIWIDQNKIVGIHESVSNQFDPKNPKFYTPSQPADRVLEVNAGFAQKNKIKTSDQINFYNIQ